MWRESLEAQYTRIPGSAWLSHLPQRLRLDFGPSASPGLVSYPPVESGTYPVLVSSLDEDCNDVAGIRLPDVAVPLATYTGWNLYRAPYPEGEMCDRDGTYVPFARTRAEREARGDPRPSLEERYGTHANYVKRYEEAVQRLVHERLLLPADGERYMARVRSDEVARLFSQSVLGQR